MVLYFFFYSAILTTRVFHFEAEFLPLTRSFMQNIALSLSLSLYLAHKSLRQRLAAHYCNRKQEGLEYS